MKDTKPVTKEALIAVIASTLAEFAPNLMIVLMNLSLSSPPNFKRN